jgi:hypothetical protein
VDDSLLWDGRFRDGTKAAPGGEYYLTLKISDAAGNESMQSTRVNVTLLNTLLPLPAFTLPSSVPEAVSVPPPASPPLRFGGSP